jgi:Uma2 family endonuclease
MDKHAGKVWTYDDLASLPDDGQRYEILDGELFASVWFAPFDVVLSPTRVVVPDLVAVRASRRSIITKRAIEAAPDLVLEVLSPSNRKHDLTRKRRFYARSRIPEYWLIDPEAESVEVLVLDDGALSYRQHQWAGPGERAKSAQFDLEIDVDSLFRDDD